MNKYQKKISKAYKNLVDTADLFHIKSLKENINIC